MGHPLTRFPRDLFFPVSPLFAIHRPQIAVSPLIAIHSNIVRGVGVRNSLMGDDKLIVFVAGSGVSRAD